MLKILLEKRYLKKRSDIIFVVFQRAVIFHICAYTESKFLVVNTVTPKKPIFGALWNFLSRVSWKETPRLPGITPTFKGGFWVTSDVVSCAERLNVEHNANALSENFYEFVNLSVIFFISYNDRRKYLSED